MGAANSRKVRYCQTYSMTPASRPSSACQIATSSTVSCRLPAWRIQMDPNDAKVHRCKQPGKAC